MDGSAYSMTAVSSSRAIRTSSGKAGRGRLRRIEWVSEASCAIGGKYRVSRLPRGEADALTGEQRETVDAVLAFYGDKSPQWLSDLTHMEAPWQTARRGVPDGERGDAVIKKESLAEYYGSL